jgi:hypothetical protein
MADALEQLAERLHRPPAGLAAFSGLTDAQLQTLAQAVDAAYERRQRQIDTDLGRGLPGVVARALRLLSR